MRDGVGITLTGRSSNSSFHEDCTFFKIQSVLGDYFAKLKTCFYFLQMTGNASPNITWKDRVFSWVSLTWQLRQARSLPRNLVASQCSRAIASNRSLALYRVCSVSGLKLAKLALLEIFLTWTFLFTLFSCNSNFSNDYVSNFFSFAYHCVVQPWFQYK